MSVFQVEEFYIYITIGTVKLTDKLKGKIEAYMKENGLDDFEWQDGSLCIDNIDSESHAECYDRDINAIVEQS